MASVASAGAISSAIVYTSALVTQSEILTSFRSFFHAGGAFIYLLGVMLGIAVFTVTGNFKAIRYLLIGPALFFLLVGPRSPTYGAVFRLGGGLARTDDGAVQNITDAVNWVHAQVASTRDDLTQGTFLPGQEIQVAMVFDWFTNLVDSFVKGAVDVILQHENDEDLLFVSRTKALEMMLDGQFEHPELYSMFENNLFGGCGRMMQAGLALANPQVAQIYVDGLEKRVADDPADGGAARALAQVRRNRSYYQSIYDKEKQMLALPTEATISFMSRNQDSNPVVREVIDKYTRTLPTPVGSAGRMEQLRDGFTMSCYDLWRVTQEAVMQNAKWLVEKVNEKGLGELPDTPANRDMLCRAIVRKLDNDLPGGTGTGLPAGCDLVRATGIMLIRQQLSPKSLGRVEEHLRNTRSSYPSYRPGSIIVTDKNRNSRPLRANVDNYEIRYNKESGEMYAHVWNPDGSQDDLPFMSITPIGSHQEGAFIDNMRYQAKGLRQSIFTALLNFPYYQGVMLYLITISYPFLALMVLVPGRAMGFFNVVMAYLWVKSWDIGFAVCRVLDKVLWGLLPRTDMDLDVTRSELPNILQDAFRIDPLYNVYTYYYLLSMALTAVPVITAYATIKARRAVLASFVNTPFSDIAAAAEVSEAAYGQDLMNDATRNEHAMKGVAQLRTVAGAGGERGIGEAISAQSGTVQRGALFGLAKGIAGVSNRPMISGSSNDLTSQGFNIGSDIATQVPNTAASFAEVYSRQQSAYDQYYHPRLGRFAPHGLPNQSKSWLAMFDGGGRYEISDPSGRAAADALKESFKFAVNESAGIWAASFNKMTGTRAGSGSQGMSKYLWYVPGAIGVYQWLNGASGGSSRYGQWGGHPDEWNNRRERELLQRPVGRYHGRGS